MSKKRDCKHCGKPAIVLISRPSPFSPQYPLCEECGNDEGVCVYYAQEQHKYKSIEQFAKDTGHDMSYAQRTAQDTATSEASAPTQ